jgi:hypothetical protein
MYLLRLGLSSTSPLAKPCCFVFPNPTYSRERQHTSTECTIVLDQSSIQTRFFLRSFLLAQALALHHSCVDRLLQRCCLSLCAFFRHTNRYRCRCTGTLLLSCTHFRQSCGFECVARLFVQCSRPCECVKTIKTMRSVYVRYLIYFCKKRRLLEVMEAAMRQEKKTSWPYYDPLHLCTGLLRCGCVTEKTSMTNESSEPSQLQHPILALDVHRLPHTM